MEALRNYLWKKKYLIQGNKHLKFKYEYPHTWKWVVFSGFLSLLSLIFAVFALNDLSLLLMYFLSVTVFTVFFFFLKLKIYSRKATEMEAVEQTPRKYILLLLLVLILGVSSPFLLILFVDPVSWFLVIVGFIAGINISEIILYIVYRLRYTME